VNYTRMISRSLWCCYGTNDGDKGLRKCGRSYDGVEGLRHLIVTYIATITRPSRKYKGP